MNRQDSAIVGIGSTEQVRTRPADPVADTRAHALMAGYIAGSLSAGVGIVALLVTWGKEGVTLWAALRVAVPAAAVVLPFAFGIGLILLSFVIPERQGAAIETTHTRQHQYAPQAPAPGPTHTTTTIDAPKAQEQAAQAYNAKVRAFYEYFIRGACQTKVTAEEKWIPHFTPLFGKDARKVYTQWRDQLIDVRCAKWRNSNPKGGWVITATPEQILRATEFDTR